MCAISDGFVCRCSMVAWHSYILDSDDDDVGGCEEWPNLGYFVFIMCAISTLVCQKEAIYFSRNVRIIISHVFVRARLSVRRGTYRIRISPRNENEKTISNAPISVRERVLAEMIKTIQYLLFKCDWTLSRTRFRSSSDVHRWQHNDDFVRHLRWQIYVNAEISFGANACPVFSVAKIYAFEKYYFRHWKSLSPTTHEKMNAPFANKVLINRNSFLIFPLLWMENDRMRHSTHTILRENISQN